MTEEQKERQRLWRKNNPDKLKRYADNAKEKLKKYYEENKEVILEYRKEYQEQHKEKIKEYKKSYRVKNNHVIKKWLSENANQVKLKNKEWNENNKEHVQQMNKQRRMKDPEKYKRKSIENNLKRCYGITFEEMEDLIKSRNSTCEVCNRVMPLYNDKGIRVPQIDHCHQHGDIRGILCVKCNSALGNFEDSIPFLQSAIAYLEKYVAKLRRSHKDVSSYYKKFE